MCGYLGNAIDSPLAKTLMLILGIDLGLLRDNTGTGPAANIDIILSKYGQRTVTRAIWWLLLEQTPDGPKPSKYTSFNTRSDKLNTLGSAGFHAYRESRCIIPATYIIEGNGAKGSRHYHRIEPTSTAFALGGLYREWINQKTGEQIRSCSVITLAPHPKWQTIHNKSTPLFLPPEQSILERWLSEDIIDVTEFNSLLVPSIPERLHCTPIERPRKQTPTGSCFEITD
ncbi:SOS response-associated peptidase family protein [Zhongshania aquimaris]|uniref:Abasic site processing protein n=1 Tax=Zhongshania aquimaris TaxID=2857107 RepID=A0ABS6VMM2_9GAMM|nr:SOS response-associated peptidase family protein [Zhongshania aquimaris]MBW2939552.1 SOS response-associated peptidase [Zhongshania aquimaris]